MKLESHVFLWKTEDANIVVGFFWIFDIFLKFCWNSLKFCEFLRRYQISSISSLSSVRWNSRNGRFAWYMSPKCKISSVSKVIDFIGRWILVGLVFGTQNCLDSVSDLKICTIFESKLIETSCESQYKRSHSDLFLACPNSALENHSSTANTSAIPGCPSFVGKKLAWQHGILPLPLLPESNERGEQNRLPLLCGKLFVCLSEGLHPRIVWGPVHTPHNSVSIEFSASLD